MRLTQKQAEELNSVKAEIGKHRIALDGVINGLTNAWDQRVLSQPAKALAAAEEKIALFLTLSSVMKEPDSAPVLNAGLDVAVVNDEEALSVSVIEEAK